MLLPRDRPIVTTAGPGDRITSGTAAAWMKGPPWQDPLPWVLRRALMDSFLVSSVRPLAPPQDTSSRSVGPSGQPFQLPTSLSHGDRGICLASA